MRISPGRLILLAAGWLLIFWVFSCGSGETKDYEGEGTVFDSIPAFEKDTFMYPISIRSSSYMFPENIFGDVNVVDNDYSTIWKTMPGLITGEYVEFEFDSIYLESVYIHITKDPRFGKVKNLLLFADDEPLGIFPTEVRIPVNRTLNVLRVEIGETEGINRVDFPVSLDSSRNIRINRETFESVYTSKSVAVSEIEFFGMGEKKYPIRSVPVKKAKMNFYGVVPPQEINNQRMMFDGRKSFGWRGPAESKDKILLFSFENETVINGLYFPFTEDLNIQKIGFRLRKRPLPEYEVKKSAGRGVFIQLKNALKGKNFEMVILKASPGQNPFIPEMLFHDGSRFFGIFSDSLEIYRNRRVDSAKGTPMEKYLDGRIRYTLDYEEFSKSLRETFSKSAEKPDSLKSKRRFRDIVFRISSNGSFLLEETVKENAFTAGGMPELKVIKRRAEGYWLEKSRSAEESRVICHADESTTTSLFRSGKEPVIQNTRERIVFEAALSRSFIWFGSSFEGFPTDY